MQSLHYNSGSIKLTRERTTMVSLWGSNEVARWISGLAGIQDHIANLFIQSDINGAALPTLLRQDFIRMGIDQLDQQLILMQSIDLLLNLVNRLNSETLAFLFMRIHSTATVCSNFLKRPQTTTSGEQSNAIINSPEFYTSLSNLSEAIVDTCHWLGRLPFIENIEYIDLRRTILKALLQIRYLIRNLRLNDQINMAKTKLILEINELRTTSISLVRQNKDSLFASDCYLTRVNLRRPMKNDVNIEYTTTPNFTHVISSIETEAMNSLGSGFSALNIGDEIIEINNQVVIGWDPVHFPDLLRSSNHLNEIYLLVKKMPRHNDDEIYTKRYVDLSSNPRRARARGVLERIKQQTQENRTMLLEQEGEIEVESDDETLYQSKRSSQIKRDQHSSLPDLTESITEKTTSNPPSSSSTSSISNSNLLSPISSKKFRIRRKNGEQSPTGLPIPTNLTPKSPRRSGIESVFSTLFRPRHDSKSIIPDLDDQQGKDQAQLVNIKRVNSIYKDQQDELISPPIKSPSLTRSSFSNLFKLSDSSEKNRVKRTSADNGKGMTFRNEFKMEIGGSTSGIVTNKPPVNHSESRKNSLNNERRRPKRSSSSASKKISCKDLGKGDCEGFLHRYSPKGALSLVQWRLFWCVLKGGTLYIFKSKDDKTQEIEIKLEGKNVSPAPERRKYAFRIADETRQFREYFYCSTRDEMAKWMNKMGLAAINFNMDDSKIGGFNKGFVDSRESSPATNSLLSSSSPTTKHSSLSLVGDSENESDKESSVSWRQTPCHHSSISDTESNVQNEKRANLSSVARSSSASASILSDVHSSPIKFASNCFVGQIHSSKKDHHQRTNSIPSCYSPADHQAINFVNAAPRLSDSDSSSEVPCQRLLTRSNEFSRSSSTAPPTPPVQRLNIPMASSESSSSSSAATSPQQYSSTVVRTSPLYISVYTSTPSIPVVKGTVSSSTSNQTVNDDDELFFTRRSPSPRPNSKTKTNSSFSRSDAKI